MNRRRRSRLDSFAAGNVFLVHWKPHYGDNNRRNQYCSLCLVHCLPPPFPAAIRAMNPIPKINGFRPTPVPRLFTAIDPLVKRYLGEIDQPASGSSHFKLELEPGEKSRSFRTGLPCSTLIRDYSVHREIKSISMDIAPILEPSVTVGRLSSIVFESAREPSMD